MTGSELMTGTEVAEAFLVDVKTVSRWARDGRIHCVKTPGGHRRYRRKEIESILNADSEEENGG